MAESRAELHEYIRDLDDSGLRWLGEYFEECLKYERLRLPPMLEQDSLKEAHKTKGRIDWLSSRISEIAEEATLRKGAKSQESADI